MHFLMVGGDGVSECRGSHHMYAARTRFIEPSMLKLFANTAWPTVTPSDEIKSRLRKEQVDIGMRLRARWQ
jgi:DNA helicase-2/ATP-dependent DNA helicase PcrA